MPRLTLQLICDDVRIENNGKLIIIGLYVDVIVVSGFPASVVLTFLQFYQVEELSRFVVNLRLSGPRGDISEPVLMNFEPTSPGAVIGLAKIPMHVESPGEYRITLTDSDGRILHNPDGTPYKSFAILQAATGIAR